MMREINLFKIFILSILSVFVQSFEVSAQNKKQDLIDSFLSKYDCKKEIIYKEVNGEELDMMLILPVDNKLEKTPVMVYTHGGGWGKGDKYRLFNKNTLGTLKTLLDNGIACATIEYRLTRIDTSNVIDCIVDCKDAARFLMKNASKYNLDINKMGVWGGSAGGHLCLMTSIGDNDKFLGDPSLQKFDPDFKCVVSYFPLTTFMDSNLLEGSGFQRPQRFIPMLGGLFEDKMELARLASPAEYLNEDSTPALLIHGEEDKVLPIAQSIYFYNLAKKRNANVQLVKVKGADHVFKGDNISPSMVEINEIAAEFIMTHLLKD